MLLWLRCRPAATAPIGPLAWEPPYAGGNGPRKGKKEKEKEESGKPARGRKGMVGHADTGKQAAQGAVELLGGEGV